MPTNLTVQSVSALAGLNESKSLRRDPRSSDAASPQPQRSPIPNPTLRLDPALGLVVIEFRDESGNVATSIPSQRQLEAYRRSQESPGASKDSER